MIEKKHIVLWIVAGVAVAALLIYFAVANGVVSPFSPRSPFSKGSTAQPGGISNAPAGVSYNQADANTTSGKLVVITGTPETPGQSAPITAAQIPTSAIKLSVQRGLFTPAGFTVDAGDTVVVSLTSEDNHEHTFIFESPLLSSVAVGVSPRETRVITFTAPDKPGNYRFMSNSFGDTQSGTMIVR